MSATAPPVPGLDGLLAGSPEVATHVVRTGDNQWLLGLRDPVAALERSVIDGTDPGVVAATSGGAGCGLVARVELDVCGAWVTVACTDDLRPIVVRRAGWVDERGDVVIDRDRPWPEDRFGLGPGDAVAVVHRPRAAAADLGEATVDPVAERLLDHLGEGALGLVNAIGGWAGSSVVAALAVPEAVAGAGPAWVAEATGVPEGDLVLPGYPLGDREPERWQRPPHPPRRATFRLHHDVSRLKGLRGVLGRLVQSWRLGDRLDQETLTLLTTELATNAIVHTDTAATATISYLDAMVRVAVHDGSPQLPRRKDPSRDELGGRGIALIEDLASSWGSTSTPTGKRTWFDLPVESPGQG